MAQDTRITQHIDCSLRYDHAMLDELAEVTAEWNTLPDGERASWSMDWDQFALVKFPRITREYMNGDMTPEQEASYRRLIQRIQENRELIERFGLTMPRIPVET
jgi:hypothetical protein